MGLTPAGITITGARTRFGSCSGKNRICFSWRLMQYPQQDVRRLAAIKARLKFFFLLLFLCSQRKRSHSRSSLRRSRFAYRRRLGEEQLTVLLNFSDDPARVSVQGRLVQHPDLLALVEEGGAPQGQQQGGQQLAALLPVPHAAEPGDGAGLVVVLQIQGVPVQLRDGGPQAGFSQSRPWLGVNHNCASINLAQQEEDPASIWNWYKDLAAQSKNTLGRNFRFSHFT